LVNHKPSVQLPEGYLEFYQALESWQNEEAIRLSKTYEPPRYDIMKHLQKSKKPLLEEVDNGIEAESLKDVYRRLLVFLQEARPAISGDLSVLAQHTEDIDFNKVIHGFCKSDYAYLESLAGERGLNTGLLLFACDHALRPFFRIFARGYQEKLKEFDFYWEIPSVCPICGAKSHICHLSSDEGQRIMFCDRCFSEWKVRYLLCVYCGHDRPGEINIIKLDDDPAYQIYVCEKCKGYLKTYDRRENEGRPVDLYITNIETIYLDMLAQEKGYTNHDED